MKVIPIAVLALMALFSGSEAAARTVTGVLLDIDHSLGRTVVTFATPESASGTVPTCHTAPNQNTFILDTGANTLSNGAVAVLTAIASGARVTIFGRSSCENNIQEINQIRVFGN
jgi:hypothetical protein